MLDAAGTNSGQVLPPAAPRAARARGRAQPRAVRVRAQVVCPATREAFDLAELRKVFVS